VGVEFLSEGKIFSEYFTRRTCATRQVRADCFFTVESALTLGLPELSGPKNLQAAYRTALWIKGIATRTAELTGRTANGNILVCP
jgi:hypothetical protein